MSWKFVLNSNLIPLGSHDRDTYFKAVVVPSGYDFFTWNSVVYQNIGDGRYKKTHLTVEDLF